jgi:hypothetical protein
MHLKSKVLSWPSAFKSRETGFPESGDIEHFEDIASHYERPTRRHYYVLRIFHVICRSMPIHASASTVESFSRRTRRRIFASVLAEVFDFRYPLVRNASNSTVVSCSINSL